MFSESTEKIDVAWALLSGRRGCIPSCPKHVTLSQLSTLLGLGGCQIGVVLQQKVYCDHADRPFLDVAQEEKSGCMDVSINVVVFQEDSWPNRVKTMRWKSVETTWKTGIYESSSYSSQAHEMLLALVASEQGPDEIAGVRGRVRVRTDVEYVVDGTFLFVELTRNFDVWFSYLGNLTIDGVSAKARSVWLHGDLHTPLQPVESGHEFAMPVVAAQYSPVHLRFEIEALPELARPFRVAFDAEVALIRTELRRSVARGEGHVSSRGWALSDGSVAYSSFDPCFLRARIDVLKGDAFASPAPRSYYYMLAAEEPDTEVTAFFQGREGVDFRAACSWYSSCDIFRGLTVVRKRPMQSIDFQPWHFVLCARPALPVVSS